MQRKWFLGKESTPGEDAAKIIEMTTMDLDYYINLVDKEEAGLERLTSILKEVLLWVKCCQKAWHATEKLFMKKSQLMLQTSLLSHFKKLLQQSLPSPTTTSISQQPSTSRQDPPSAKGL